MDRCSCNQSRNRFKLLSLIWSGDGAQSGSAVRGTDSIADLGRGRRPGDGSPQPELISFGGSCQCPHACQAYAKPSFLIYNRPFQMRYPRLIESILFVSEKARSGHNDRLEAYPTLLPGALRDVPEPLPCPLFSPQPLDKLRHPPFLNAFPSHKPSQLISGALLRT